MGGRVAMRAASLPEAESRERHQGAPPFLALANPNPNPNPGPNPNPNPDPSHRHN